LAGGLGGDGVWGGGAVGGVGVEGVEGDEIQDEVILILLKLLVTIFCSVLIKFSTQILIS
jgi:hypothetical protein